MEPGSSLTYSMQQIPSWEANRFSDSQEIPLILLNTKVHYRIYMCRPRPYSEPARSSPYSHPISWRSILIVSSHLNLGLPSGLLSSGFPTKTLYTPLLSSISATYPARLILFDTDCPCPKPDEFNSHHPIQFLWHHFNFILSSTSRFFPFRIMHQDPFCFTLLIRSLKQERLSLMQPVTQNQFTVWQFIIRFYTHLIAFYADTAITVVSYCRRLQSCHVLALVIRQPVTCTAVLLWVNRQQIQQWTTCVLWQRHSLSACSSNAV